MKKISVLWIILLCVCVAAFGACGRTGSQSAEKSTAASANGSTETGNKKSGAGIRKMQALSVVYSSISTMIDSLILEYGDEVVLPDKPVQELYSFIDGNDRREVTAVYTNESPQIRADGSSVPGRYVIVRLQPEENSDPKSGVAWRSGHSAGRTVLWDSSHSVLRKDYSAIRIEQKFDAVNARGVVIQAAGVLPQLQYEDISWPQLKEFSVDNVLSGKDGDIHYSFRLPDGYDPSKRYPMVVTLPGYNGLLLSMDENTRGVNIYADYTVVPWTQAGENMVIVSPQLTGWDDKSARQTIELTEYFLKHYAVDSGRVYAAGYSAGGETMSRVMGMRADLFTAYLHGSSQWDGNFDSVVKNQTAVYIYMAENDDYYGKQRAIDAYEGLKDRYKEEGLSEAKIANLLVLDLRKNAYFNTYGLYSYHAAGMAALNDQSVIHWILRKKKSK